MKKLFILAVILTSCAKEAESIKSTSNSNIKVDKLFTNDGITVYRFEDAGRYIYYTDARGRTEWVTGGKHPVYLQTETVE